MTQKCGNYVVGKILSSCSAKHERNTTHDRLLVFSYIRNMLDPTQGFTTRILTGVSATCLAAAALVSCALSLICTYQFIFTWTSIQTLTICLFLGAMHLAAVIFLMGTKKLSSGRNSINKSFWTVVPSSLPWLKTVPIVIASAFAIVSILYLLYLLEYSYHLLTHHVVPQFVASNAKDLNELLNFEVSAMCDRLMDFGLLMLLCMLAIVIALDKVVLPKQVNRWHSALITTECFQTQVHLLTLITTTYLFLYRYAEAEKSSKQLLKIASNSQESPN